MFCLFHEGLIKNHLQKETLEMLEKSSDMRKTIFNNLTVGINVVATGVYQEVAEWLLTVPENELKGLTMIDAIKGVGEYIDNSGRLV